MYYRASGINFDWFLSVDFVDDFSVFIYDYFRLHLSRELEKIQEIKTQGEFILISDHIDSKINLVKLGEKTYQVVNPKTRFDYGSYSVKELMEFDPCYYESKVEHHFGNKKRLTVREIASMESIPPGDRIWCLVHMIPMCDLIEMLKGLGVDWEEDVDDSLLRKKGYVYNELTDQTWHSEDEFTRLRQLEHLMTHVYS